MDIKTKTKTEQILTVMNIVAYIAMVGYAIETGAVMISYIVSFFDAEAVKNIYRALDLSKLRDFSFWQYTTVVSFLLAISILKVTIWDQVIKLISKVNLTNPFTLEVAQKLERISYLLLATSAVGVLSNGHSSWLSHHLDHDFARGVGGEFLFMAGLIFIISQIFKRGVEIQSENDLTV